MRVPETAETQRLSETLAMAEEQSNDDFVASASASLALSLSFFDRFARPPRRFFFSSLPFSFLLGDGGASLVAGTGGASLAATTADITSQRFAGRRSCHRVSRESFLGAFEKPALPRGSRGHVARHRVLGGRSGSTRRSGRLQQCRQDAASQSSHHFVGAALTGCPP